MAVFRGVNQLLLLNAERLFTPIIRRPMHCNCPSNEARRIQLFGVRGTLFQLVMALPAVQNNRFYATKATQPAKKGSTRSLDVRQGPTIPYNELPIIHVHANNNNTRFTVTDHNGYIAASTSAGIEGFKGAKRGTNYAGQMAAIAAAKKAKSFGIHTVRVKIKGMGPGRNSSIKGLTAGGIDVISITDVTPVPHNGCKPPKQRRI